MDWSRFYLIFPCCFRYIFDYILVLSSRWIFPPNDNELAKDLVLRSFDIFSSVKAGMLIKLEAVFSDQVNVING